MAYTKGPLTVKKAEAYTEDDGLDVAILDGEGHIIGEAFSQVGPDDFRPAEDNARLWASAPALQAEATALRQRLQAVEGQRGALEAEIAALRAQLDELAAACRLALTWWEKPSDTAHLQIRQWTEQMRAALARLPSPSGEDRGEAGE